MTKMFQNAIKAASPNSLFGDGIIPNAYELSMEDAKDLYQLMKSGTEENIFNAMRMTFIFGFVMGNRATHSRKLKRI